MNPQDAQSCTRCAALLPGRVSTVRDVRKTVTVVFADVVGSTALVERLDAEAVRLEIVMPLPLVRG